MAELRLYLFNSIIINSHLTLCSNKCTTRILYLLSKMKGNLKFNNKCSKLSDG